MNETYYFRLFVAGEGTNSRQAIRNLNELCESHLAGRCRIEIIDVLEDFRPRIEDRIFVTPALILVDSQPAVVILGNLSNAEKAVAALRLEKQDHG